MNKIKVFIVDDSLVVRHLLSEVITKDPELELMGYATNGQNAIDKLATMTPDVLVMDIEMPEMDGLQALPIIRKSHPQLPVLMCSTLTQKGAEATLKALSLGAADYVAKPSNTASLANSIDELKNDLIPKIKSLGASYKRKSQLVSTPAPAPVKIGVKKRIDIVAIGVSTGGPNALEKLFSFFPANFPLPIVLVQHMPPSFTKLMSDHLNSKSHLTIQEAKAGDVLKPGHVLVAPGGLHMVLTRQGNTIQVATNSEPPENSCRPSVDVLFRSVNDIYGDRLLAVIMTGMGSDGFKGCEAIRAKGGRVLAQDEESSVVWGMPGFVAKAGLADAVLPIEKLAGEIIERSFFERPGAKT